MSRESCTAQLTIRPGEAPMLNLYAENIDHLVDLLRQVQESGLGREIAAMAGEPPDIRANPRPRVEAAQPARAFEPHPDPDAPYGRCPKHNTPIARRVARTNAGQEFESFECRERDDDESRGWCRMRLDPKTGVIKRAPNPGEDRRNDRRPLAARLA